MRAGGRSLQRERGSLLTMDAHRPCEPDARERLLLALVLLSALVGCGSRTGLLVSEGAAPEPCTDPPWILFDHLESPVADVYAMRADGSELHRVALSDQPILYPTVSRDGRFIAFVLLGDPLTPSTVGVYDVRSGTTQLLSLGTSVSYPAFSPDASLISYADGLDLRVVRRDGTDGRTLITGPYEIGCCSWGYGHPVFENASTILWTTAGLTGSIQTDGTGMISELVSDFTVIPFANPTLSPDGTQLGALISCPGTYTTELRIYSLASLPADCSTGRVVAEDLLSYATVSNSPNPAWGPTNVIAFTQARDVFVVDADGGSPRNLTSSLTGDAGAAGNPVWAPGCIRLP